MKDNGYDNSFYAGQMTGSVRSASVIVPMFQSWFGATSVVDIGCGVGGWLSVFRQNGASTVLGMDGDYVDRSALKISADEFRAADLGKPQQLGRFDAAISMEVAEHLPGEAADGFVETLVKAAPVVLFSAAIPHQGGVHHVNEQWQSWWAERFAAFGYVALDCIRPLVWRDTSIEPWYRQNAVVYCVPGRVPAGMSPVSDLRALDMVHPDQWAMMGDSMSRMIRKPQSLRQALDTISLSGRVFGGRIAAKLGFA
ncbi:MAG: methyltransferase domain-containing protein [Pseudomonadota bacterium]